ncbi:MAG: hypothetical protein ABIT36_00765 [Steroidobacteraceae bacterium]
MSTLHMLQEAALKLASNGTVKDRLLDAYCNHLTSLDEATLPKEFRDEFGEMCRAMHRERPLPRENAVRASVRKMSNEEAHRYAALVVRLYGAVARAPLGAKSTRTPVMAPIVQLFAAADA